MPVWETCCFGHPMLWAPCWADGHKRRGQIQKLAVEGMACSAGVSTCCLASIRSTASPHRLGDITLRRSSGSARDAPRCLRPSSKSSMARRSPSACIRSGLRCREGELNSLAESMVSSRPFGTTATFTLLSGVGPRESCLVPGNLTGRAARFLLLRWYRCEQRAAYLNHVTARSSARAPMMLREIAYGVHCDDCVDARPSDV
jgi:hypothetical protein